MIARALVLAGPSGAGKTTLARRIVEQNAARFGWVRASTTRARRDNDAEYEFLDGDDFERLATTGQLLTNVEYAGARYGIPRRSYDEVIASSLAPVLILTAESALALRLSPAPITVFLDAPDAELDRRLSSREATDVERRRLERSGERELSPKFQYVLAAGSVSDQVDAVLTLYELAQDSRTGVLPERCIKTLVRSSVLLEGADSRLVQPASYDLRLGDEYFYGGVIHRLSDEKPILTIESYDYAIVTTRERANLPRDVCARFDLAVSLFAQGVLLSNGPQIDPGFRGPLFCLLFNTSSSPVMLKRGQHYSTIEFHRLFEPTTKYQGPYQEKDLLEYLPANAARGAINELKKELTAVREEVQKQQTWVWAMLSLILALVAVLVAVR